GGLAALTGMVVPALGQVFGWIAWLFLAYTIGLVRAFAAVPGAAVPVAVSPTAVLAIYALIFALTWLARQPPEKRVAVWAGLRRNFSQRAAVSGSLLSLALVVLWGASQPDGRLHVAFLDVGQGDAIFIQTPSGRQILVDGGHYPSLLNDRLGRQMPFWDRQIDLVVATHPDADHVSGLVGVFERFTVDQLVTDGSQMGGTAVYDAVLLAAQESGVPIHRAQAGETIRIDDGVRLEILNPGPERDETNRNENSVSFRLVYGDFTLLLTGDAEQAAEGTMLASGRPLSALVFKAGHHGSDSSSSAPFLTAVHPQIIVISVGAENNFGHPAPEMLGRAADVGAAVLRTDELGTIEVMTDGRRMWWQSRR
ncbi:MAG: ComEC/Rec2 family competence protein, partial [Anaerolineae bacterium]